MDIFDGDFEGIYFARNNTAGLRAIIALHDLTLGPGLGGIRIYPYKTENAAVTDAMRLARAMTYKNAIIYYLSQGRLSHGGGKGVIWADPQKEKTRKLLLAMADAVNDLGGKYIGGEDMGMKISDVGVIFERTPYVTGLAIGTHVRRREFRAGSGDPCPITAFGTLEGIEQCLIQVFGSQSMQDIKMSIQGIGGVGAILLTHLVERGARILAADTKLEPLEKARALYPDIEILDPQRTDDIYDRECDVFVPCAIGGILNEKTTDRLQKAGVKIIAGCANNQLLEPHCGIKLWEQGVLYAPDYVINAGGAINVAMELAPGGYNRETALEFTKEIKPLLARIFSESEKRKVPPQILADEIAEQVLANAKSKSQKSYLYTS